MDARTGLKLMGCCLIALAARSVRAEDVSGGFGGFGAGIPWSLVNLTDTAALAAAPLPAADEKWGAITVYWENDGQYYKPNHPTDRHYTNGTAVSFSYQPQWAQDLAGLPLLASFGPAHTAAGLIVGQLMCTPEDTATTTLITNDRPYAGYLFLGGFWQRTNQNTFDQVQVELGFVGRSSLAEDAQKWIHSSIGGDEPQGWGNQIGNEVTIQVYLRRKWRFDLGQVDPGGMPIKLQVIPEVGVALGTVYRYIEGGGVLRLGVNLPDDFGPGRLADVAAATGAPPRGWTAYLFTRATGRAVEHNLLLEGSDFGSTPGVDEKPLTGELQIGAAVGYRRGPFAIEFNYSQTFFTKVFAIQRGNDVIGAYVLSVHWDF